ncbi:fungal-specific transcription factor domain-containing protein [Mycena metata]|uniref:Fungal-specific transcription factor domain-containing protein n=1 Tax=Mycena metata TaxID=1033252 RepID=A0AAD7IS54_9AGAR|nr:fungal-specific transcription factor domain-containing protein [Mycena metata]
MSSEEDERDGLSVPAKKRRVQRACDVCRRKKRACDGLRMSEKKCTHCIENGLECTFSGAITKRRSYVDALEARLEMTEQLLRKLAPQQTGEAASSNSPSPGSSSWSKDSPTHNPSPRVDVLPAGASEEDSAVLFASIRTINAPPPPSQADDLAHIELVQNLQDLSLRQAQDRFHGKSSGAMLVKAAVLLREGYEEKDMPWVSRRMHFWRYNPFDHRIPHVGPFVFPVPDLFAHLIDLYFVHKNLFLPVLHRPTFERSIAEGLHLKDDSFSAIVLLVCGIGARYSDDARIAPPGAEPLRIGWQFFDQIPLVLNPLFERPTLHLLQFYCLAVMFLEFTVPSACWNFVGLGLRLAQDIGAHRDQNFGTRPTVTGELWKRAFWVLITLDRMMCTALGRSPAMHYEDFDAELPLEVDDEYWEGETATTEGEAWKQPSGKPARVTFFCCFIKLNNILAFALKMLYPLNKLKRLLAHRNPDWEEHVVAELDSALNNWVDSIPAHLRWEPNRRDETFFDQSTYLYSAYYSLQVCSP